jgi:hypothetical protein
MPVQNVLVVDNGLSRIPNFSSTRSIQVDQAVVEYGTGDASLMRYLASYAISRTLWRMKSESDSLKSMKGEFNA